MGQTSLDMKSHHQQQQHSQQREVEHNSSARELMAAAQLNSQQQQHQEEEGGGVQQQLVRPPEHSPAYMEHSLYPADKKGKIAWNKHSLHVRSEAFLNTLRLETLMNLWSFCSILGRVRAEHAKQKLTIDVSRVFICRCVLDVRI